MGAWDVEQQQKRTCTASPGMLVTCTRLEGALALRFVLGNVQHPQEIANVRRGSTAVSHVCRAWCSAACLVWRKSYWGWDSAGQDTHARVCVAHAHVPPSLFLNACVFLQACLQLCRSVVTPELPEQSHAHAVS